MIFKMLYKKYDYLICHFSFLKKETTVTLLRKTQKNIKIAQTSQEWRCYEAVLDMLMERAVKKVKKKIKRSFCKILNVIIKSIAYLYSTLRKKSAPIKQVLTFCILLEGNIII